MNSADPHVPFATAAMPPAQGSQLQLLSNGRCHVMPTRAGGGYTRWNGLAAAPWHADPACDDEGAVYHLRDALDGETWSAAYQPALQRAKAYETAFTPGLATIRRCDDGIDARTDTTAAPEDDVELRRLYIANPSGRPRAFEMTTYAQIVLAPAAADTVHPAFSRLFVETEILPERGAILAWRRASSGGAPAIWMFHLLGAGVATEEPFSFETDRRRFVGRVRSMVDPQATSRGVSLSASARSALDTVAAIRCRIALGAGAATVIDIVSGVGPTREACLELIDKYRDRGNADRVLAAASAYGQSIFEGLHATPADALLFEALAAAEAYPGASLRALAELLARSHQGQSLGEALAKLIADLGQWPRIDAPGGLFLCEEGKVLADDLVLVQTVARVVIVDADAPPGDPLVNGDAGLKPVLEPVSGRSNGSIEHVEAAELPPPQPQDDLILANGTGGLKNRIARSRKSR